MTCMLTCCSIARMKGWGSRHPCGLVNLCQYHPCGLVNLCQYHESVLCTAYMQVLTAADCRQLMAQLSTTKSCTFEEFQCYSTHEVELTLSKSSRLCVVKVLEDHMHLWRLCLHQLRRSHLRYTGLYTDTYIQHTWVFVRVASGMYRYIVKPEWNTN